MELEDASPHDDEARPLPNESAIIVQGTRLRYDPIGYWVKLTISLIGSLIKSTFLFMMYTFVSNQELQNEQDISQ